MGFWERMKYGIQRFVAALVQPYIQPSSSPLPIISPTPSHLYLTSQHLPTSLKTKPRIHLPRNPTHPREIPRLRREIAHLCQTADSAQQKLELTVGGRGGVLGNHFLPYEISFFFFWSIKGNEKEGEGFFFERQERKDSLCPLKLTSTYVKPLSVCVVPNTPAPATVLKLSSL